MAIVVRCECGRQLQARDEYAGRRTKCPDCGRELTIPGPGDTPCEPEGGPMPGLAPRPEFDPEFRETQYGKAEARTSGMAIASLVLGILSFVPCLGVLTFIPAIVLGILALNQIGKAQGQVKGKGLAIAGISTGGVGSLFVVIGVLVALLLPAVQAARGAAQRAQCANNLKQIGLALHNFHDANGHFPGRASVDADGKPLLSWRVALLPYLEQQALYAQFHLDEPWDSPHNLSLVSAMPATYLCPSEAETNKAAGLTSYRVITGPGTLFEDDQGTRMATITDGLSNTLAVVESRNSVPWTKPDELEFDPASPALPPFGSPHPGGFNALFGDGSVRFLKKTVPPTTLRALITRNGNEVVTAGEY